MRLIDADKLLKDLFFLYDDNGFVKNEESRKILTTICEEPTAYDIDKVVDELKELKAYAVYEDINADTKWLDKAIEIVKQGSVRKDVE